MKTEFVRGCASLGDLDSRSSVPEVALLGRSNAGKSSLLNTLAGIPKLARTSRTPGRTQQLNLFAVSGLFGKSKVEPDLFLVDCPGYGYARTSQSARREWGNLMQMYLEQRRQLRFCVQIVDAMVPLQEMDLNLHRWLQTRKLESVIVANKTDRLSGSARDAAIRTLQESYGGSVIPFSAKTGLGRAELWRMIVESALAAGAPGGTMAED